MNQTIEIKWNNQKIVVSLQAPHAPQRLVIMLHGGPGGSKDGPASLFCMLEARLNGLGYATCRFDFRGSGESSGTFEDVTLCSLKADFIRVKNWCAAQLDVPVVLVGESLGATIAIMGVGRYDVPMALLWPAIDLRTTSFNGFMTDAALETLSTTGHLIEEGFTISHRFIDECMTLDLWPKIAYFKGRYFIAHGQQDRDVPSSQSDRLAKELGSHCEYLTLPHAGHGAKDPDAQQKVLTGLTDWIRSL